MSVIIYVRHDKEISLYQQFNECARYAKNQGYSINGKVFDFDGKHFHDAINKVVANNNITSLIIYNKELVFPLNDDYLFYRIYLERLGKKLIAIK